MPFGGRGSGLGAGGLTWRWPARGLGGAAPPPPPPPPPTETAGMPRLPRSATAMVVVVNVYGGFERASQIVNYRIGL